MNAETLSHLAASLKDAAPAIANHLWQSTVFAAVVGFLTLILRSNQARARHWLWMAASVKFLLPFALFAGLAAHFERPRVVRTQSAAVYSAVEDFSEPFARPAAPLAAVQPKSSVPLLPLVCAGAWTAGFVTVLGFWSFCWMRIARRMRRAGLLAEGREVEALRRIEAAAGVRRAIRLRVSTHTMEPGVFGIVRPVLAWPAGLSERLDDTHLEAILAHEVCHVRRRDNLASALHMLVEAAFWFYPLVWWLGARLIAERERACDEEVLLLLARPREYAESILKVCEYCVESPLACVSGVTGADLKQRVRQIMSARAIHRLTWTKKLLLLAAAAGIAWVPLALAQAHATQRLAFAALKSAPAPIRTFAHTLIPIIETPSTQEIAEMSSQGALPAENSSSATPFKFDVVSIRPAAVDNGRLTARGDQFTKDGFVAKRLSLVALLLREYGFSPHLDSSRIIGGPEWVRSSDWDIRAKVADSDLAAWSAMIHNSNSEAAKQQSAALQALLEDRFKLKTHFVTKEETVYALEVAKGGPTLKRSSPTSPLRMTWGPGRAMLSDASVQSLGPLIERELGHPVIDKTGITGRYDITLTWAPAQSVPHTPESTDIAGTPSDAPSIFTALQEQLGLKLVAQKGPVEYLVIDSAEKPSVDGAELAQSGQVNSVSMAQDKVEDRPAPTFTVTSVRPNPSTAGSWFRYLPGGRLSASSWIKQVIEIAYGLKNYQVTGGPGWLTTQWYDIEAKADDPNASKSVINVMTQALLADRFKLKFHMETKTFDAYDLVVDKNGSKLKPLKEGENFHCTRENTEICGISDPEQMANWLTHIVGKPVFDRTGITGRYEMLITFDVYSARGQTPPDGYNKPLLEDALREQLGLRLAPHKEPMPILVIDHIEKPTPN